MATTTSAINHQDIHHQGGNNASSTTLHQLTSDSDSAKSSSCSEATAEDLIFFHTQSNPIMDFLLEAGDTGSSRESLVNLLDEGLGTSLDGTEELCTTHPTIGRNDSGVFSSDEASSHQRSTKSSISPMSIQPGLQTGENNLSSNSNSSSSMPQRNGSKKSNRQKHGSPNRQGPQRCVICGKTFSNASALTKHKLTHSDERKHTCTVCGKAFKRQDHLNGHMLTHRSKKPFQCSASSCGKSYCDARSLRRHVESRHGAEALANMTIAPTPSSDSDYSIIIPNKNTNSNSNGTKSSCKPKGATSKSKKKGNFPRDTNSNSSNPNNNPLLCQGSTTSSSQDDNIPEDNELLTSVESLLNLEDSTTCVENAAALLDASLMEMGVIQEEIEQEMSMDINFVDNDKLNNNSKNGEGVCCVKTSDITTTINNLPQSQLHQLLTQRARDDVEAAAVTFIKESLIASCANSTGSDSTIAKAPFQFVASPVPWMESSHNVSDGLGAEMGKGVSILSSTSSTSGGILLKCPSSGNSCTQTLKEQLELIHQIIQQTAEESAVTFGVQQQDTTGPGNGTGGVKGHETQPQQTITTRSPVASVIEEKVVDTPPVTSGEVEVGVNVTGGGTGKADENKPVECAICCRKFKNTPALNGHMRLHGGYFKKEADGKKKESSSKEKEGTPLQTASISVRALIEEKIIQRRANSSASSSNSSTPKTTPPNSIPSTPTKKPNVPASTVASAPLNKDDGLPCNSAVASQVQPLPFEDAHAEYLLIEEEVFNKVSSICPDSFFSGIDESLLCESGTDSSQISADFFNWTANSAGSVSGASPAMTNTSTATSTSGIGTSVSGSMDNPFTPLPTMDPVFFTPTPGSVHSHHSQNGEDLADSPSFIYPTPPASLESHNALQSPLFPFPFPFDASPQGGSHTLSQQMVMVSPASTCSNGSKGSISNTSSNGSNNFLLATTNSQGIEQCSSISGSLSHQTISSTGGNGNQSEGKPFMTPSLLTNSSFSLGVGNPLSQMKGNEPYPMEESLQSPNRNFMVNSSPGLKVPNRKALLRNTLASNLRNHSSQSSSNFTPYPILSPVRSAPGLYWTFSVKLAHVDESRKDRPRINIGANFQAVVTSLEAKETKKQGYAMKNCEALMWSPDCVVNYSDQDVDKYLEFACCSAIPGGGRNKEYALHILNLCNGNINVAMLLLMNPNPKLPLHLAEYKYPERERWSKNEIIQWQELLLRHGKDFLEISKELGTKSREACVSFYQVWKKVCPQDYEKVRSVWKKREAAFTVELLKTIPPPLVQQGVMQSHLESGKAVLTGDGKTGPKSKPQQSSPSSRGIGANNDEFPCKICGKIFNKVKSRSAHMKSHRPPPTPPSNSPAPALSPASAATLAENKEKIADALQKHIFGKACASLAKTIQAVAASGQKQGQGQGQGSFIPKIVKVESLTVPVTIPNQGNSNPSTKPCFQQSNPSLQLQAI